LQLQIKKWNSLIKNHFKEFCEVGDTGTEYTTYERCEYDDLEPVEQLDMVLPPTGVSTMKSYQPIF